MERQCTCNALYIHMYMYMYDIDEHTLGVSHNIIIQIMYLLHMYYIPMIFKLTLACMCVH